MSVSTQESSDRYVLVVDDDDDLREALTLVLGSNGRRVATASSGEEAFALLTSGAPPPCVVLLDLMMPGMNGFELRSRMMSDPSLNRIPVVVFTGSRESADASWSDLQAPVVHKPVSLSILLETIELHCRFARAAPPATA